jgi:uncharacterized protein (TIGR02996 family)
VAGAGAARGGIGGEVVNEEQALLAAIIDEPADDTRRLVYADWLDEFGSTDQQVARSEWIRLTCWTPATRKCRATGVAHRIPGEPAWLRANAHRLWPALFALKAPWWRGGVHASLLTGVVTLSVPIALPTGNGSEERLDYVRARIKAARGVTSAVQFGFLRAARVAPAAAADEPHAELQFCGLPERCYAVEKLCVWVYRRPFALRGLADVWNGMDAEEAVYGSEPAKIVPRVENGVPDGIIRAGRLADAALTEWARAAG